MFGWGELGIIIVLAIVLLGPDKLPEVARTLGRLYAEYNQAKKRFELELLQGQEFPQKDFLEKMSMNKMNLIKQEVTSDIKQSTENYLNTESDNNMLEGKEPEKKDPEVGIKDYEPKNPVKEVGEKKEVIKTGEKSPEKAGVDKK
ncbi:MAG TPA: twin-arginine translocase TatA/TatE family subunit [Archaeoglobaceae archaeon]|nr:twin-arginine translocase TatA/TatE family subunit [Archaeoglobaceae archaeon]